MSADELDLAADRAELERSFSIAAHAGAPLPPFHSAKSVMNVTCM